MDNNNMERGSSCHGSMMTSAVCVCGDVEFEKHVLLDYSNYVVVRRRWKEKMFAGHADMYNAINNEYIEKETMCYLGIVWPGRQRSEFCRLV